MSLGVWPIYCVAGLAAGWLGGAGVRLPRAAGPITSPASFADSVQT